MPHAPAASCRCAIAGILCVFTCTRKRIACVVGEPLPAVDVALHPIEVDEQDRRVELPDVGHRQDCRDAMDELTLLDWKRRVFELYAEVRADRRSASAPGSAGATSATSCSARTRSRRSRPDARARSPACRYFDYDPALRVLGDGRAGRARAARDRDLGRATPYSFTRFARRAVRARRRGAVARPLLARRLRRRRVPPVRRRDERRRDVRRRPLPARHGQGRRPRRATTAGSCSTSTSPTTRRARTTRAGSARSRRPGTGSRRSLCGGERGQSSRRRNAVCSARERRAISIGNAV